MVDSPFTVDPVLTGVAMAYQNGEHVADLVLPRLPPFERQTFKYSFFSADRHFTIPNTLVGRRSVPDEVDVVAEDRLGQTYDYGLDHVIPNVDRIESGRGDMLEANAAEMLADLVSLDREARVAAMIQNPDNYVNKAALSGASKWTEPTGTPIQDIKGMIDSLMVDPNIMVLGADAWSALTTSPQILKAISVSGTDQGIASKQAILNLFGLEDIIVAKAKRNTVRRGEPLNLGPIWGPHVAIIRRDPLALNDNGRITFGFTAQFSEKVVWRLEEPKHGLRGSVRIRFGESVGETIVSDQAGALLQNVA